MLADFKKFAFKGNVVDLAVGVIIGGAFNKIVTGVVNDVVMPVVSLMLPQGNWRKAGWTLREAGPPGPEGDTVLLLGDLAGVALDFLIVAFVLFLAVRTIQRLRDRDEASPAPATRPCPFCRETVAIEATRCRACTSELPASTPAPA